LANRVRQEKLAQCRSLLGQATRPPAQQEAVDLHKAPCGRTLSTSTLSSGTGSLRG